MPPKRTLNRTPSSEEISAKRSRTQDGAPQNGKSQKRQTGTSSRREAFDPSSIPSTSGNHQQGIFSPSNIDATANANEARFSKLEKSIDDLNGSVAKIEEHLGVFNADTRNESAHKKKAKRMGTSLKVYVKPSRSFKIKPVTNSGDVISSTTNDASGQPSDVDHPFSKPFPGTSPCTSQSSIAPVSPRTPVPNSSVCPQAPSVLSPDNLDIQGITIDDICSANLVKLIYLATKVDMERISVRKEVVETSAKEVGEVFENALKNALKTPSKPSFNPVKTFVELKMSQLRSEKYSNQPDKKNWQLKSNFMSWFLSMKHLGLDTSSLDEVAVLVRKLCGMADIDRVEGAFMNNESLVMSKICDLMTCEQVSELWKLCTKNKEPMAAFEKFTTAIRLDTPGMKELVFFSMIRNLELKHKFNTLYTDLLLKYIRVMSSSQEGSTDNLDQVCKILETYEILVQPVGYCIVFCVLERRPGAKQEIENIENTFGNRLGYKVEVIQNPTKIKIETEAKRCSESAALGIYDSFVCFLLAHGNQTEIVLSGGEKISRKDFLQMFAKENCFPKKPKLFLMGSCQGEKIIARHNSDETDAVGDIPVPEISEDRRDLVTVHAGSDRLVAYATLPEHSAVRHKKKGSYFVTFICKQIQDLKHQANPSINVVEVLQRANREIHSILFTTNDRDGVQRLGKQACYYESTLQKNFRFRLL